jgi:hypothetical protein
MLLRLGILFLGIMLLCCCHPGFSVVGVSVL